MMGRFNSTCAFILYSTVALPGVALADGHAVSDDIIAQQRAALADNTLNAGFGPQSPRDLDTVSGNNTLFFNDAPPHTEMNLCNIHFHENAEHRGGEYTTYAGNGDGHGVGTGYRYDGELTEAELAPVDRVIGAGSYGDLAPGDTIEVHYVHSTAKIEPGPTLGACLSDSIMNPQLRVEGQVFVLVNDDSAADFMELAAIEVVDGFYQAVNIPTNTGQTIQYDGSTTGPSYNENGSPLQVSWSMRPEVVKVSISSVEAWLADNVFDETAAHGVRNLVINPDLISTIGG